MLTLQCENKIDVATNKRLEMFVFPKTWEYFCQKLI